VANAVAALTFRRARRADLPRLLALLADDVLGRNREAAASADPAYAAAFAAIDADPNQQLLVAEADGTVVGMLQVTFIPGLSRQGSWRANVEAVRVAAELRGRGIGSQLMAQAEQLARERGCRIVQLTSDLQRADAHRFYTRLGYSASHAGFKKPLVA
jgi:GNAT superfamily N-acetyltransferase